MNKQLVSFSVTVNSNKKGRPHQQRQLLELNLATGRGHLLSQQQRQIIENHLASMRRQQFLDKQLAPAGQHPLFNQHHLHKQQHQPSATAISDECRLAALRALLSNSGQSSSNEGSSFSHLQVGPASTGRIMMPPPQKVAARQAPSPPSSLLSWPLLDSYVQQEQETGRIHTPTKRARFASPQHSSKHDVLLLKPKDGGFLPHGWCGFRGTCQNNANNMSFCPFSTDCLVLLLSTGVYQAAQNMATTHLAEDSLCFPEKMRKQLLELHSRKGTAAGGKIYWAKACHGMGMIEDEHGVRFGSDSVLASCNSKAKAEPRAKPNKTNSRWD